MEVMKYKNLGSSPIRIPELKAFFKTIQFTTSL